MAQNRSSDWAVVQLDTGVPTQKVLVYSEGLHSLSIFLELSGFGRAYDWVGGVEVFESWEEPSEEPIPAEHAMEIRARIVQWASQHQIAIGFEAASPAGLSQKRLRDAGYAPHRLADGTTEWRKI